MVWQDQAPGSAFEMLVTGPEARHSQLGRAPTKEERVQVQSRGPGASPGAQTAPSSVPLVTGTALVFGCPRPTGFRESFCDSVTWEALGGEGDQWQSWRSPSDPVGKPQAQAVVWSRYRILCRRGRCDWRHRADSRRSGLAGTKKRGNDRDKTPISLGVAMTTSYSMPDWPECPSGVV